MKKLLKRFLLIGAIVAIVRLGMTSYDQKKTLAELEEEKKQKETDLVNLDMETKSLEEEIENADSLEFVEKIAREKLRMVGPDDLIYIGSEVEESEED